MTKVAKYRRLKQTAYEAQAGKISLLMHFYTDGRTTLR
jgi:hypothetical protein